MVQGMLQEEKGIKVTLSETVQILIHHWNPDLLNKVFKLEEKQ